MKHGQPAGSSMPLCWAHAEYVTLVHSIHAGYPLDRIPEAWQRYVASPAPAATAVFWSLAHRTREMEPGTRLIVILDRSVSVRWKTAESNAWLETQTSHRFGAMHIAEIGPVAANVEFRFDDEQTIHQVNVR